MHSHRASDGSSQPPPKPPHPAASSLRLIPPSLAIQVGGALVDGACRVWLSGGSRPSPNHNHNPRPDLALSYLALTLNHTNPNPDPSPIALTLALYLTQAALDIAPTEGCEQLGCEIFD